MVLAWSLYAVPAALASHPVSPARKRHARIHVICPSPAPGHARCTALLRVPVSSASTPAATAERAAATTYTVNDGAASSGPAGGLTPEQLASAYSYEPSAGGAGQTVAIVDAFDDPVIEGNLAEFDAHYGLSPCTTANGCFQKVGQSGSPKALPQPDTTGWSVEISLDVETVHAACPNCKILLVEASEPSYQDLAAAVNKAVNMGATEVSNSYAGPETGQGEAEQAAYNHAGVVIAAASGDDGYYEWDVENGRRRAAEMPDTPATLPSVVAVGATTLNLNSDGTRAAERVWNENGPGDEIGLSRRRAEGATGGGCSTLFTAPPWQQHAQGFTASGCGTKRLAADVSAVGDPDTGFDIFDTYNCGPECKAFGIGSGSGSGWLTLGGTSLSTPLVTSLYALAGGAGGLAHPALTLYGHLADSSSLFDVTEGGNGFCDAAPVTGCQPPPRFGQVDCEGTSACNAEPGLDGPTGVGTPIGLGAFKPLFPTAVITAPTAPAAGVPASFGAEHSSDPYPGGSIVKYAWEWGDESVGSGGVSPMHTFPAPGGYPVTLAVTDNYGLTSATATTSVVVSASTPEEEAAARQREEEAEAEEDAAAVRQGEEEAAAVKRGDEEAARARSEREREELTAARKREEGRPALTANLQEVAAFHAATPAAVPDAKLASTFLPVSASGRVVVEVTCPIRESSCAGTVTLRTLGAFSASALDAASRPATILTLAKGPFTVAAGKAKKVPLRLSARARTLLARSHSLRVRATIAARDPAGASHTAQTIATLRLAKAKHGKG